MAPKRIILLGATGSIGKSVLDVVQSRPDLFEISAMSAHRNEAPLLEFSLRHCPKASLCLTGAIPSSGRVAFSGKEGLKRMIQETQADIVMNGIAGASGLEPSLDAIDSGKDLALANKETVVLAGRLVQERAAARGIRLIPVDSEHAALFQMLERFGHNALDEVILTASGGAFRDRKLEDLPFVTPEEASTHPNWSMGRKITIDSASMANKGLEVIEAVRIFGVDSKQVRVLIHPQSQIHALIRTKDGALYAQASGTDMRIAIQAALTWPHTEACAFGRLDLAGHTLTFQEPDYARYPLLALAYTAVEAGEGYTIAYNATNEVAVELFIQRRIRFTDIAHVVQTVLEKTWPSRVDTIEQVYSLDLEARKSAADAVKGS
jgi:1-deoxy-D-xylulose-5-phosphate reductoisomerase